ncbi:LOW QUALITY PROTEIN: hyphally regulated cell wall protein 1 [Drosophila busckii]|uniref:LOW QUALITY PROTEIN: hyphally regulated cell wall protein 1 n=1 Tax=Drosophila busckii TaxID=30019 RepID=UPI001432EB6B|nr:LOW QUALITY PROTEIN: hyphally regulated cell wall protein 1 [Drosophila busckii]
MLHATLTNLLFCCLLLTHHVQGQANKVSSKLDFDEAQSNNNKQQQYESNGCANWPGTGTGAGTNVGYDQSSGRSSGSGSSSGNRPKIHGVRVTVDTGDGQQQTKESKESVEITDLGKHKKRVGIHTDITFEITAEGGDANETSSSAQQQGEKEDASVPIYKGRGGGSGSSSNDAKHKSHQHYDPKAQWNPNYSGEHRAYDAGRHRGSGSGYYPQYYPEQVYTTNGGGGDDVGSIYRNSETWTHYVPVWTTERSPHEQAQLTRRPSWKPCYCMSSYGADYRRRRDSKHQRRGVVKGGVVHIDGKLEQPFS